MTDLRATHKKLLQKQQMAECSYLTGTSFHGRGRPIKTPKYSRFGFLDLHPMGRRGMRGDSRPIGQSFHKILRTDRQVADRQTDRQTDRQIVQKMLYFDEQNIICKFILFLSQK